MNESLEPEDIVPDPAEELKKLSEQELHNSMIATLSSAGGRHVLWTLLERCGIFRTSFVGEQPMTMAFREGEKQIGKMLYLWVLQTDPKAYSLMQAEHLARQSVARAIEEEGDNNAG
jgi:hypothetical protein